MSKTPIHFSKLHSLGNDFMIINVNDGPLTTWYSKSPDLPVVRQWADRHRGIGFDQLLLLENGADKSTLRMRIFNADGSESEQCGNGVRCAAKFARLTRMVDADVVSVQVADRVMAAEIFPDGRVGAAMGAPDFEPRNIPLICDEQALSYTIDLPERSLQIGAVSMGNPHAVVWIDQEQSLADYPVDSIGAALQAHRRFPEGANVEFVHRVDAEHIDLRVYERGVGETLACGSGACAAVAVGQKQSLLNAKVSVCLRYGVLEVEAKGENLFLTGAADWGYDGVVKL